MAESQSIDCPCSNIAIMQLFHELKQSYPSVPDQIVSKVIQENYHDKSACETILQRENYIYLQTYPGAIISGNSRESEERGSLCNHCPASRPSLPNSDVTLSPQCGTPNSQTQKRENAFSPSEDESIYSSSKSESEERNDKPQPPNIKEKENASKKSLRPSSKKSELKKDENVRKINCQSKFKCDKKNGNLSTSTSETSMSATETTYDYESNSLTSSRTCCSECDSERKSGSSERSHCGGKPTSLKGDGYTEVETVRWEVENDGVKSGGSSGILTRPSSSGQTSVHNYQVAVQYSMQPALPLRPGDQQRSFTTVNLSLRPPSSEPQPPIEIQSGQNLTYTTSVFDAKKGVQSQLQIKITPGGGGTVSACRTYISSPQVRYSCRSPHCIPQISTGFHCQNNHHLKALLEKQKERKDLLARELRKEKEKLRCMQNDVRLMKAAIAQKPSPYLLPKLKAEIERLRTECERLTAAVDVYSDTQNSLPLGETDEEFYRNIYTGQRLQSKNRSSVLKGEGSWSCQLCTFRNHPLLTVCEECEMPRISLGTQVMDVAAQLSNVLSNNNTSFCTGGGTSTSASLITAPLQER